MDRAGGSRVVRCSRRDASRTGNLSAGGGNPGDRAAGRNRCREAARSKLLRYILGDNRLARFGDVVQVSLGGKQATDATMRYVGTFNSLEVLELTNTQVTDAGLDHLNGM